MKRCNRCGVTKPVEAFRRQSRNPDGRDGRCRTCKASPTAPHQVPREAVTGLLDRTIQYAERCPKDRRFAGGIVYALVALELITTQQAEQFTARASRGQGG